MILRNSLKFEGYNMTAWLSIEEWRDLNLNLCHCVVWKIFRPFRYIAVAKSSRFSTYYYNFSKSKTHSVIDPAPVDVVERPVAMSQLPAAVETFDFRLQFECFRNVRVLDLLVQLTEFIRFPLQHLTCSQQLSNCVLLNLVMQESDSGLWKELIQMTDNSVSFFLQTRIDETCSFCQWKFKNTFSNHSKFPINSPWTGNSWRFWHCSWRAALATLSLVGLFCPFFSSFEVSVDLNSENQETLKMVSCKMWQLRNDGITWGRELSSLILFLPTFLHSP